ncbi:MAG: hypothetical protein ACREMJ_01280 [Gemmatimonadales bacterium]
MDLRVTHEQFHAIETATHLPDVLKAVLQRARSDGDGRILHLTYEEATALNELCAWNVHTDAQGNTTPESQVFDALVRAIITHPDY